MKNKNKNAKNNKQAKQNTIDKQQIFRVEYTLYLAQPLAGELLLLQLENEGVKLLLETLVGVVDQQLLQGVGAERLEPKNIKEADESGEEKSKKRIQGVGAIDVSRRHFQPMTEGIFPIICLD